MFIISMCFKKFPLFFYLLIIFYFVFVLVVHCTSLILKILFLIVKFCIAIFLGVHNINNIFDNFCKTFLFLIFFHHWPCKALV
jgi:hypothetical protein